MSLPIPNMKTTLSKDELEDKIKGIIFGVAIGDGVGLATEFMNKDQARIFYGNGPIKFGNSPGHEFWRDAFRGRWFENDFTDDTDQTLLILQSLLENKGSLNPINFAHRLREWGQVGFPELGNKLPNGIGFTVGSTFAHEEFLTNPLKASYDVWDKKGRNLAANGALMRTGVLGIPYFWDERKVVENSMLGAKVTHADPRSVTSAVVSSVIISRLMRGLVEPCTFECESEFTEMIQFGSTADTTYLENFKGNSVPPRKEVTKRRRILRLMRRFAARFKRGSLPLRSMLKYNFSIPKYKTLDQGRYENPAPIRPNVKPLEEYGADPDMMNLCKSVVDKYKFLVEKNPLCPQESGKVAEKDEAKSFPKKSLEEANWVEQLYAHSFPESLSSLKLDKLPKIGYTFKCLGAALYLSTRRKPDDMTSQKFFENIITQLVLEAGDADTNCAAAGAILGCRLGKSGLPKEWVEGLRHYEFLENISGKLCEMVLASMTEEITE